MNIYRQIEELELELNGIVDLEELVEIRRQLEELRAHVCGEGA